MTETRGIVAIVLACLLATSVMTFVENARGETWLEEVIFGDAYDLKYYSLVTPPPPDPEIETKTYLDRGGSIGLYTSLGMKVIVNPPDPPTFYGRISYYDVTNGDLKYAYEDASGWHVWPTPIDSAGDVGQYTSIAIGSDDFTRISYYDTAGKLKYARQYSGGGWIITEVHTGDVGRYTSLALDSYNHGRISYYDDHNGALRFAYQDPDSVWRIDPFIDVGSVGLYTSIAIGPSDGYIRISYYDDTNGDLKYAIKDDDPLWHVWPTPIDSAGNVGMYTSIAVDSDGYARISYYDETNKNLKIATQYFELGEVKWKTRMADNDGDVGLWTSLELDIDDNEFVSYGAISLAPSRPIVAAGCDDAGNCEYVHMLWVQDEIVGEKPYQRVYYQRSSDGGETWDLVGKPISSLVENPGSSEAYKVSRPSIHVNSESLHVAWIREYSCSGYPCLASVYYQQSTDNGDTWLTDAGTGLPNEVQINDLRPSLSSGIMFPGGDSPVSIVASNTHVHIVWEASIAEVGGGSYVLYDKCSVTDAHDPTKWGGEVGEYPSIVVDSQGRPYISYYDKTYTGLKLAGSSRSVSGLFQAHTVDGSGEVGEYTSIAINDEDQPNVHISYYDKTHKKLKYAYWNGYFWEYDTPDDSSNTIGLHTSIAVDSDNHPHISYYDETDGNLKYAFYDGDSWIVHGNIDPDSASHDVGLYTSIAVDSDNHPHISYYDETDGTISGNLKYAYYDGGTWSVKDNVDKTYDTKDVGSYTSIALDSGNHPHISYYDATNTDLKYAYRDGASGWVDGYTIDGSSEAVGEYTSIALDSWNHRHISYYDAENARVKRIYWDGVAVNQWQDYIVENGNFEHTSIAVDSQFIPHISYFDLDSKRLKYSGPASMGIYDHQTVQNDDLLSAPWWDMDKYRSGQAKSPHIVIDDVEVHVVFEEWTEPNGDLEYAFFEPGPGSGQWRFQSPDEEEIVGTYSSMELDPKGLPHVSYHDSTHGDLKYAWQDDVSGLWQSETVDAESDVGYYSSIALENSDPYYPHIAYLDYNKVKYAYKDSGGWRFCSLYIPPNPDSFLYSPGYISMTLDSSNHPHISFVNFAWVLGYVTLSPTPGDPCNGLELTWDPSGSGIPAKYTSIAVDDDGDPHITHMSVVSMELMYVYYDSSVSDWIDEVVDNGFNVGHYNSLALDQSSPDNMPHVSYYDERGGNLKYAYKASNKWHLEGAIDAEGDVGLYTSIALGTLSSVDLPHISYADATNGYLKYAYKDSSGDWQIVVVDDSHRGIGYHTSIALEPDLPIPTAWYPHISYYDDGGGRGVVHVRGSATGQGQWTPEAPVTERFSAQPSSPRAELMGDSLVVVWEDMRDMYTLGSEIYSTRSNGWDVRSLPIDTQGDVGQHSSTVTWQGYARTSYYDASKGDLRYAYEDADGWRTLETPIDTTGDIGQYSSIAVDAGGYSRISYYDATNGDLRYAYEDSNGWNIGSPVEISDNAGMFTSMEVGSDGKSRISYYKEDATSGWLKYAIQDGSGGWTITPIDGGSFMPPLAAGHYNSLAMDPTGTYGRISYCDALGVLKFIEEDSGGWGTPVPVDQFVMCEGTSIAVDSSDLGRIAYYDGSGKDLRFAYQDASEWKTMLTPIDSSGDVGMFPSISIDADGFSRISYYDETNGDLKYAYKDHTGWHVLPVPIDDYGDVGQYASIAMDSSGQYARLSYYDETNGNLKYAYENKNGVGNSWGGSDERISDGDTAYPYGKDRLPRIASAGATAHVVWQMEKEKDMWIANTIKSSDDVGQYTNIIIDYQSDSHLSYFESLSSSTGWLWYKAESHGGWARDMPVDNSGGILGKYNSIALDDDDLPHFSYWDESNNQLKYAYVDSSYFSHKFVVDTGNVGKYTSLARDSEGKIHISYYDYTPSQLKLKYAYGEPGNWDTSQNPDPDLNVGQYTSLALDSFGYPHISYYDEGGKNLRYAYKGSSGWTLVDVDGVSPAEEVGEFTSLVLDSQNNPHISYFDFSNQKLKHAYWDSDPAHNWVLDEVDFGNFQDTSIDLDSKGEPHISYYDATNQILKYAFRDANGWHASTIDSNGDVGRFSSISLATSNVPYIGYYDNTNLDLKRAYRQPYALEYSTILYDENRHQGDPLEWGTDSSILPNQFPDPFSPFRYAMPDIAAVGNDRHIVYEHSSELSESGWDLNDIGYSHRIDSIVEKNPMAYLKGTSAVRVPMPGLGRDQIFIIGGINVEMPPYYSDIIWRYDPLTDTHNPFCNIQHYGYGIAHTSAVYDPNYGPNGMIFIFGGIDSTFDVKPHIMGIDPNYPATCDDPPILDLPAPTFARYGTSAVHLSNPNLAGDGILIFGGYDANDIEVNDIVWWQPLIAPPVTLFTTLPSGRAFTSAITMTTDREYAFVFGGEQYVGGPNNPYIFLNEVVKVYHDGLQWVANTLEHTAFSTGRSRAPAISDGFYGYILGGRDEYSIGNPILGLLDDIIRFNPRIDSENSMIELCTELPTAREYASAAYYGSLTINGGGTYTFGGGIPMPRPNVYQYVASYDKP